MNYIVQYCSGPLQVQGCQKKKLIECFSFLRALACKNTAVQTRYACSLVIVVLWGCRDVGEEGGSAEGVRREGGREGGGRGERGGGRGERGGGREEGGRRREKERGISGEA